MIRHGLNTVLDIVVVGTGPAGLATLHAARDAGLSAIALDKGPLCGALLGHPTYMRWFSTADKLELAGFPLVVSEKNPTRREYLDYCRAFVDYFDLKTVPYHEVTSVTRTGKDPFTVVACDRFGIECKWTARNVVMATGYYDSPRMLNVPGESLPHVSHRYVEPQIYAGLHVLVIGAGNSATEAALELWRHGNKVTIAMRGEKFVTKYWLEPDIENRIKEGAIACHRNVEITEILPDRVLLQNADGSELSVKCDAVLAMTGYVPDTTLLEAAGANVDCDSGKPVLTEAYETTVPGLYAAGTLCSGKEANVFFVENSREHGPIIVADIL